MCANLALSADLLRLLQTSLIKNLIEKSFFCKVLNVVMEPIIAEKVIVIFDLVF